jgi:type IV pilus assembly protein PilM
VPNSIWKKEISLRRAKPNGEAEPAVAAEPVPADATDDAAAPSLPRGDYGWLTTDYDPQAAVPTNMPTIAPPLVSLPGVAPPPVAAIAQEHETTPAPAAADRVPFWKKDLSLSRAPKAPKAPKQAKAKAEKQPSAPFWKKELSAGRKAKEPKAEKLPKAPSAPFWKKELSVGRKPKAAAEAVVAAPKEKKPPIWKRELSVGKPKADRAPKVKGAKTEKRVKDAKGVVVGLKIGASQVAAARVSNNGSPQLMQYARAPLAEGIVVGGELRDIDGLAKTLKELFSKHKLPRKGVRLGIANNRIGVRTFEIGGIDDPKQLANAIRFRAQETLPIPLDEAVLDWQILSERVDEETGATTRRVMLVVAYRELVDQYVAACKKAGIRLAGIDLEAFAMLRALAPAPVEDDGSPVGAQVTVNVGHQRSTFAVAAGDVCEFTRVLGWGGANLDDAIAHALDLTPVEAAHVKHALSLVATADAPVDVPPEALATARDAVLRELQAFARELVSSLRFYQNQPGSLGIGEVVLTGGSASLPGFAEEMNRLIGVNVRIGDPLNRVTVGKRFRDPDGYGVGSLTVAIGLGIED